MHFSSHQFVEIVPVFFEIPVDPLSKGFQFLFSPVPGDNDRRKGECAQNQQED